MIKAYLKNTKLWVAISYSDTYQKFRNPKGYQHYLEEVKFYTELLRESNHPNDVIFDIGANIGTKISIFSKLAKTVVAFEPSEKLFALLQKRFSKPRVQLFNIALGSQVSSSEYYEIPGKEAYNSLSKKHIETTVTNRNVSNISMVNKRIVNVDTVERFIKEFGVPKYLKIDVEGYEYEVIQGLKTAVPLVSLEINLPDFLDDSVKMIAYLSDISSNRYVFNFTTETSFLLPDFIDKEAATAFLLETKLPYLELYAKLKG
jgi:FkbM family methyltransferase